MNPANRAVALLLLAVSISLLLPGLLQPVITIRGLLEPDGMAELAPQILRDGISDETIAKLKPMLNPLVAGLLETQPGGIKGAIVSQLGGDLGTRIKAAGPIEAYLQTRSIIGSIQHLFEVRSTTAAILVLLFSVIVPFGKALLVLVAVFRTDPVARAKTLHFVEMIAKWSMADVFAVALFIAFLAAQASQTPPGPDQPPPLVTFTAVFGPGFYWFAGYCLFSLFSQQITTRALLRET
jgi:hypothetical protein